MEDCACVSRFTCSPTHPSPLTPPLLLILPHTRLPRRTAEQARCPEEEESKGGGWEECWPGSEGDEVRERRGREERERGEGLEPYAGSEVS
eukprot:1023049-Rhodomonas_salina.1